MEKGANSMINTESLLCARHLGALHVLCHLIVLTALGPLSTLNKALCTQSSDCYCTPDLPPPLSKDPVIPVPGPTFHYNPETLDSCLPSPLTPELTSQPGHFRWDPGSDSDSVSLPSQILALTLSIRLCSLHT